VEEVRHPGDVVLLAPVPDPKDVAMSLLALEADTGLQEPVPGAGLVEGPPRVDVGPKTDVHLLAPQAKVAYRRRPSHEMGHALTGEVFHGEEPLLPA
jgi:hypothetical protein